MGGPDAPPNKYIYGLASPLRFIDPSGLKGVDPCTQVYHDVIKAILATGGIGLAICLIEPTPFCEAALGLTVLAVFTAALTSCAICCAASSCCGPNSCTAAELSK